MKKHHQVENVRIEKGRLHLVVDGHAINRDLKDVSQRLADATAQEQSEFEVSPSGYGIHWPSIDEDISIDGLLGVAHKPDSDRRSA